jgi:ATP-dependent Clp protease ATP-binding subunit ClpA
MATFTRTLETTLRRALSLADERLHEYVTLEHLLASLVDDDDAAQVMSACKVDLDRLRASLDAYMEDELDNLVVDRREREEARPTAGFQRCLQRAMLHVDSSGQREVTGANVLVALFSERESHAAYFLQEQDMTRYDAVNFISHGLAKRPGQRPALALGASEHSEIASLERRCALLEARLADAVARITELESRDRGPRDRSSRDVPLE